MRDIFNIFKDLKSNTSFDDNDLFSIASLPNIKNHKIGTSRLGLPMFFIKCANNYNTIALDSNLEFIAVKFNRLCQLKYHDSSFEEDTYTIISLKSDSIDIQEYFLEVVFIVIKRLNEFPQLSELKIEVEKIISLFSKFSRPPLKTIQGLWAELLVIEQSKNPEYLIISWHSSISDKFDFNDSIDKIEVKSTSKSRRIHTFAIEQLTPNRNSSLVIVSVFAIETGIGKNISDLIKLIEMRIKDEILVFRLNEIVAQTLGSNFEKSFEVFYDYQFAIDTLGYYNSLNVPKIDNKDIPAVLSNIKFDCDLTDIESIKNYNCVSVLHNSLFKRLA